MARPLNQPVDMDDQLPAQGAVAGALCAAEVMDAGRGRARSADRSGRLWRWLFGVVVDVVVQLEHRRAGNMRRRLLDEL